MIYTSNLIKELQLQIKLLEQKKTSLSDAAEIKATNKKINELQKKCGELKEEYKNVKDFLNSIDREFNSLQAPED